MDENNGTGLIALLFGTVMGLMIGGCTAGVIAYHVHVRDLDGYTQSGFMAHNGAIYHVIPTGRLTVCVEEVR